jgi:hypothetical protein
MSNNDRHLVFSDLHKKNFVRDNSYSLGAIMFVASKK